MAERFIESHSESDSKRKAGFAGKGSSDLRRGEIRDYLPYATAVRMREFITFTLKLEGLSPDLDIDNRTQVMLSRFKLKTSGV